MNQPDFGRKVAELRQEQGLMQEELAEICEVSARTIQRIENKQGEPRAFTRNNPSRTLEFDFGKGAPEYERFWLAVLHLSIAVSILFIPLLIWSWLKDRSYTIDRSGRDVLNFQITINLLIIANVLGLALGLPVILILLEQGSRNITLISVIDLAAFLLLLLMRFFTVSQAVLNPIRVLGDQPYRVPLSIKSIRSYEIILDVCKDAVFQVGDIEFGPSHHSADAGFSG